MSIASCKNEQKHTERESTDMENLSPRGLCQKFFPMKNKYDFSESVQNPYFKKLKKQVTIRLEEELVDYFRALSVEAGIPYQSLINLYLQDCMRSQKKLSLEWV